jgi:hypothetical protein
VVKFALLVPQLVVLHPHNLDLHLVLRALVNPHLVDSQAVALLQSHPLDTHPVDRLQATDLAHVHNVSTAELVNTGTTPRTAA